MAKFERKDVKKKKKIITKPIKIAALVVSAIEDLRETKGTTPKQIIGYINYASKLPMQCVKLRVKAALKRGVEYGILRRYRGYYFLSTSDELDRANRIAGRFARLPTPAPLLAKSKTNASKVKDRKRQQGVSNKIRKSKKVDKIGAASASPSLMGKTASDALPLTE